MHQVKRNLSEIRDEPVVVIDEGNVVIRGLTQTTYSGEARTGHWLVHDAQRQIGMTT